MREYTVFYTLVSDREKSRIFRCLADDTLHAINQAINAVLSENEVIDSISKVDTEIWHKAKRKRARQ